MTKCSENCPWKLILFSEISVDRRDASLKGFWELNPEAMPVHYFSLNWSGSIQALCDCNSRNTSPAGILFTEYNWCGTWKGWFKFWVDASVLFVWFLYRRSWIKSTYLKSLACNDFFLFLFLVMVLLHWRHKRWLCWLFVFNLSFHKILWWCHGTWLGGYRVRTWMEIM